MLCRVETTPIDYYATIRSLYLQRRTAQIRREQTNLTPVVQRGDLGSAMTYTSIEEPSALA